MVQQRIKFFLGALIWGAPLFSLFAFFDEESYFANPKAFKKDSMKVCVYYDLVESAPNYRLGELYSIMTQNLLGHFREVVTKRMPAGKYQHGDLNDCDAGIYIGSHYDAPLTDEFFYDVADFKKPFLWMNYGIWRLKDAIGEEEFVKKVGFKTNTLYKFENGIVPSSKMKNPDFYRNVYYKGERFFKYARFDESKQEFIAAPEIMLVDVVDGSTDVLSYAEHTSGKVKTTPYITHKENFFYVADLPFIYIHESDRYLILCDVLFDFLKLPPREKKRNALMRLEDIHPLILPEEVNRTVGVMSARNIPFAISVIPRMVDPVGYLDNYRHAVSLNDYDGRILLKSLRNAVVNGGAKLIYHGYTHQDPENEACAIGNSGDGFEFWNICKFGPLTKDSPKDILAKLDKGSKIFKDSKLEYHAWVTPHYQASVNSYKIFADYFPRTVQRARYVPENWDQHDKINWAGQFFPYTIEKDYYGQWIWPESLGNILMPYRKVCNEFLRSPEEIIASAKLLRVVRDSWASFFWHSYHFNVDNATRSLEKIVDAILDEGFEFVDISEKRLEEEEERKVWDQL